MKYLIYILLLVGLCSCYKYVSVDNSLKYTVEGVSDITIDQNDTTEFSVFIQLISGDPTKEYITCSISGLPANVYCSLDTPVTFRPNYGFELKFYGLFPSPGVYPLQLIMNSPSKGTKIYSFNLTVTSITDCTKEITSNYLGSYFQSLRADTPGGISDALEADIDRVGCDTLSFRVSHDSLPTLGAGQAYSVASYSAALNCSDNTLTIYPQLINSYPSYMVKGKGIYTPTTSGHFNITLTDTSYNGATTISITTITIHG